MQIVVPPDAGQSGAVHSGGVLLVISGLPGTGKSAVAAELSAVHLSVDRIEDALRGAGLPDAWQTGVAAYEAARATAEQNLELGRTVVVDAVNDSEPARETWRTRSGGSPSRRCDRTRTPGPGGWS